MFKNITEDYLWGITRESIKIKDTLSPQYLEMGQTERYLRVVGKMVNSHFRNVESLFSILDADECPETVINTNLESLGLSFIPDTLTVAEKRDILKNYPSVYRYVGTRVFLDWILWKVLKWRVSNISKEVAANLLRPYKAAQTPDYAGITLYDNGISGKTWVLYDKNAVWSLTIVTYGGSQEQSAFDWVTANIADWILSSKIDYQTA